MPNYVNAYTTTLDGAVNNSTTTFTVIDSPPAQLSVPFRIRVKAETTNADEICLVTAIGGTGNKTWTVVRAYEAWNGVTTASAHSTGATVQQNLTAGTLLDAMASPVKEYFGYNAIGASTTSMTSQKMYAKQITTDRAGILQSIEAYMDVTAEATAQFYFALFEDSGSNTIGNIIELSAQTAQYALINATSNYPARWVKAAITAELTPNTKYWIGVSWQGGSANPRLYHDTGGSDRSYPAGVGPYYGDGAYFTQTDETKKFSIRGLVIGASSVNNTSTVIRGLPTGQLVRQYTFDSTVESWTISAGTITATSGQARLSHNAAAVALEPSGASNIADGEVEMDVTLTTQAGGTHGIIFRATDASNHYLWIVDGTNTITLNKCVAGSYTAIKTSTLATVTAGDGTIVKMMVRFYGTKLELYLNGTLIQEFVDNTHSTGRVGYRINGSTATVDIDNVRVYSGVDFTTGNVRATIAPNFLGRPVAVAPIVPMGSASEGTNNTADIAWAIPIIIPGTMLVRALHVHCTSDAAGSIEWGVFNYNDSTTAAVKLVGGSASPGGTGYRAIAATGAPVTVSPGAYMLVVKFPTSNVPTLRTYTATTPTAVPFNQVQTSYTWDDTPDFTSASWVANSTTLPCYLEGDLDYAGSRWI